MSGDKLTNLPVDNNNPSNKSDIDMINAIFKNKEATMSFIDQFKFPFLGACLMILINLPFIDKLIKAAGCENDNYHYLIKFFTFFIGFYLIMNKKTSDEK